MNVVWHRRSKARFRRVTDIPVQIVGTSEVEGYVVVMYKHRNRNRIRTVLARNVEVLS